MTCCCKLHVPQDKVLITKTTTVSEKGEDKMNSSNETIVQAEFLKKLREAKADEGYVPVPRELESRAKKLLGNKQIVSYSNDSKFKKKIVRLKNRIAEMKLREARNSELIKAQR